MNKLSYIFIITFLLLLPGCSDYSFKQEKDVYQWLNDEENGLIRKRNINGFTITVKLLPAEYLVYNELKNSEYSQNNIDSLLNIYSAYYTFLLTITKEENEGEQSQDIMYYNISNKADYKKRVADMNFRINEMVTLEAGNREYNPVLHKMENIYGLRNQRSIYIVFADEENPANINSAEQVDFILNDIIFNTGISHYIFKKSQIDNIPKIDFWNIKN